MGMIYLTVSMMVVPLGLVIFVWGLDKVNQTNTIAGAIIIALGVVMWSGAMRMAKKDQDEETKRQNRIIALLEAIASKMK